MSRIAACFDKLKEKGRNGVDSLCHSRFSRLPMSPLN
jgi:hypothetical protein